MRNKNKTPIHPTVLSITNIHAEELMRYFCLTKGGVFDEAEELFKSMELKEHDIAELLRSLGEKCVGSRVVVHPTVLVKTAKSLKDNAIKYKTSMGDVIDVIVELYRKENEKKTEYLQKKKIVEPRKENFVFRNTGDKILFIFYDKYPEPVSYDEFLNLMKKMESGDKAELSEEEIRREFRWQFKHASLGLSGARRFAKYYLTETGLTRFLKETALNFSSLLNRTAPFIEEEWLIGEAERIIREKQTNTLEKSLKYFFDSIATVIKKEHAKKGKLFKIKDEDIVLITEKLLEAIKAKNPICLIDNNPLNSNERRKLDKLISRFERIKIRRRLIPRDKILLCLLKSRKTPLPFGDIREKADLKRFYGNYNDIFNQLEKNGWISVERDREIKEVRVTNKNIRTILGIVEKPSLAEKLLELVKENKKILG